jgi:hypothetical protein
MKAVEQQNKKERVLAGLDFILLDGDLSDAMESCIVGARDYIEELATPCWETPEQWEAETGKSWLDD